VAAMKAGAHDYVMKDNLARLGQAVERELREAEVRRERRRAEEALRRAYDELETRVQERTASLAYQARLIDSMRDAIVASGAESLYWCMQCGLCTGTCPWRLVPGEASEQFNIRMVQRLGQLGLEGFESDNCLFACTTCRACVDRCPRGVDIIANVRGMRSMLAEVGTIPQSLKPIVGSLHAQGNPWSGDRNKRTEWIKDIEVPTFSHETEYFLFVCCTSCYDMRSQKIARSVVKALQASGVRHPDQKRIFHLEIPNPESRFPKPCLSRN